MISVINRRQWKMYAVVVIILLIAAALAFLATPKANAAFISGNPGTGSGGGGAGYWTPRGHGWKVFSVDSSGPNGGFYSGSWFGGGGVQAQCRGALADKVWVRVVQNASGDEKSFTFTNTNEDYGFNNTTTRGSGGSGRDWWVDRPSEGGDPYKYDSNGNASGATYGGRIGYGNGGSEDIVRNVRAIYEKEGGSLSNWGFSVGWFCWNDNPPWTISVTSTADKPFIEPGETAIWTHALTNNGPANTNRPIVWRAQNKGSDWPGTRGTNWTWPTRQGRSTVTQTSSYTAQLADYGKTLCRSTIGSPRSNVDAREIESTDFCVIVGRKPKVQVHGGDLSVGKAFTGTSLRSVVNTAISPTPGSPNIFGSWVEYGIFATGTITGAASGSGLAGASGQVASDICTRARLSFVGSRATCSTSRSDIGNYTPARLIPDVSTLFPQAGATISAASVVPNDLLAVAGTYVGTRTGNLTINASNLLPGKSVILKVSGTVTIAGNQINNPDNNGARYQSIAQLPQLVIVANRIIINGAVSNVDAWLVANGTNGIVETCDTGSATYVLSGAARLSDRECNVQLTVNGPIMAKQLWLRRTFGTLAGDIGTPAEIINLRPDAFLWARAQVDSQGRLQTVYTTELPPRL